MPAPCRGRLVVGRPVDRAALQEPDPHAAALRRSPAPSAASRFAPAPVCAMPSRSSARDRAEDRRAAVIDVVGDADRRDPGDAAAPRRRSRDRRKSPHARRHARSAAGRDSIRDWRRRDRPRAIPARRARNGTAGSSTFIKFTSPSRISEVIRHSPYRFPTAALPLGGSHRYDTPMAFEWDWEANAMAGQGERPMIEMRHVHKWFGEFQCSTTSTSKSGKRRAGRGLRPVRLRQIDDDPLHQPARRAPAGRDHRRRHRADRAI